MGGAPWFAILIWENGRTSLRLQSAVDDLLLDVAGHMTSSLIRDVLVLPGIFSIFVSQVGCKARLAFGPGQSFLFALEREG